MILVTGHGRHEVKYRRDFLWSSKCWTHNVCRAWEVIFWRRLAPSNRIGDTIKPYSSFDFDVPKNYFKVRFHCAEAVVAHVEGMVRQALAIEYWKELWKAKDYIGLLKHPVVVQIGIVGALITIDSSKHGILPLMVGAIAIDGTGGGNVTFSLTTSGSNRILFVSKGDTGTAVVVYNSVSMTLIAQSNVGISGYNNRSWSLVAPSTGSNTVDFQSGGAKGGGASYTGASQGALDNTGTGSSGTSPLTLSITTVADLCWVFMGATSVCSNSSSIAASTGSTLRGNGVQPIDDMCCGAFDNNAAKTPAGSVSMSATYSNTSGTQGIAGVQASFAPVSPTAIKTWDGLAKASIKTVDELAIASVKTINGLV